MILEHFVVGGLETNCYLVGCQESREAALIDPGGEIDGILDVLKQTSLRLKYILITHGHFDHVLGVGSLHQILQAEILMHRDDLSLIAGLADQAALFGMKANTRFSPSGFVTDSDVVEVGTLTFRVLHTPGHSSGSVSFHCQDSVFAGDTLFAGSIGRTDLPGGSLVQLSDSIHSKLFVLDNTTKVYPGHGPFTTIGEEKKNNAFVSQREGQ